MLKLFSFILLLYLPSMVCAQEPFRISAELSSMINVPALIPEVQQDFTASSTVIHFDKLIKISNSQNSAVTYLYINTQTGETATRTGRPEAIGNGSIDINDEKFTLTYYRPAPGIIINFYNSKKKGVLQHYSSTLNTEINPASFPGFEKITVSQSGTPKKVLLQNFTATPYRTSESSSIFLCGGPTPGSLQLKRFIGFAGIGYLKTNRGIYMVTEIVTTQGRFEAEQWQHAENSIDLSLFTSIEAGVYTAMEQKTDKALSKLESRTPTGDCADMERQLIERKKANTRSAGREVQNSRAGNLITDTAALVALMNTINPEHQVQELLLSMDLSLCKLEAMEAKTGKEEPAKKACIIQNRQQMQEVLIAMRSLRAASASARDMMRLQKEKKDLLFDAMRRLRKCN